MKRLLTGFLTFSSVGLLVLTSCKKNDTQASAATSTSSTLTASATTINLDKSKVNDTTSVVMFTFTAPKYSYKAGGTKNQIQIDLPGDNWKNAVTYSITGTVNSQGLSTLALDKLLIGLKLPVGQQATVVARVVNAMSAESALYSNTVTLTATPFNLTSFLYVTGNFSGWGNPGPLEDSLVSATSNGVYTGIINFVTPAAPGDDEFLVLPVKGSWTNKYATNDPKNTTSKTITYNGPNNFYAPGEGFYMITFDVNKNLISFQPVDYYSVTGNEVVGGDWGVDQFMKYINDGSNTWTTTLNMAPVSGGGFKIRYDAQWTYSWGPPQAASVGGGQTGVLASDKDDNLSVTAAGNYTTTITASPSNYGAIPPVLVPYTFSGK